MTVSTSMPAHHAPIRIAIIGASGYTGAELIRLLHHHPYAEIMALAADSNAGQPLAQLYPHFQNYALPPLVKHTEIDYSALDVVFCCLPHATSQAVIKELPAHLTVIDLSADFRLTDPATYEHWYGHAHQALHLQKEAVYGLTELYRERIRQARLIACPGCYPTSASLPLAPLLKAKIIQPEHIIIDSKSGISGAGRSLKAPNLFCEVNEDMRPYGVCSHRHMPEIEQTLSECAGQPVAVHFTPQVVPISRGMLSVIYATLAHNYTLADLRTTLEQTYANEPFVQIAPQGHAPTPREVAGTNQCRIGIFPGRTPQHVVLISVIDNLIKGASGQAVQNMNLRFGLPETTGLLMTAVFP